MIFHEDRLNGIDIRVVACIESLAEKVMKQMNRDLIIVFGYRSLEEQDKLYQQGRTLPGPIVTRAQAGQSPHNFDCAVDCWVMDEHSKAIDWNNEQYKNICRSHAASVSDKIVWGGTFITLKDFPHWELKDWRLVRAKVQNIIPNVKAMN